MGDKAKSGQIGMKIKLSGVLKFKIEEIRKCKLEYDFREMTKVNKAITKKPTKRLQHAPKMSQNDPTELQPGVVVDMDRLVKRLMRDDVDLVMPSSRKKPDKMMTQKTEEVTAVEKDCISMLENLAVGERREKKREVVENKEEIIKKTEKNPEVKEEEKKIEEEMPKKTGGEEDCGDEDEWEDFVDKDEENEILQLLQQIEEAEMKLMKIQKTPSPPKSKRKKMNSSPRKTPGRTSGRKKTAAKFTIGNNHNDDKLHTMNMREEKMKREESLRREKRERVLDKKRITLLEIVSKPLLTTPNKKRQRAEDGVWEMKEVTILPPMDTGHCVVPIPPAVQHQPAQTACSDPVDAVPGSSDMGMEDGQGMAPGSTDTSADQSQPAQTLRDMSSLTPDMVPTSTDQPKPTHTTYSDEDVVAGSSVVTDNIGRSEDLGDMSTLTPDIIATPANQPKPIQAANSDEGEVTGNSESGDDLGGERRRQAAAIKPGVTQTPLSSFLVPQTPEQRKKAIMRCTMRRESKQEMSASPTLKLPEAKKEKKGKMKKGKSGGAAAKPLGKVAELRKYFGSPGRPSKPPVQSASSVLSSPLMAQTKLPSVAASPEMALQVTGLTEHTGQRPPSAAASTEMALQVTGLTGPIGREQPGHVTAAASSGPIGTGIEKQLED